jgi:large subunit ribosomal protein L21
MFAVIRTGGKQHRVAENDHIVIERLAGEPGDLIAFDQILMLATDGEEPLIGAAVPSEARVFGRVLAQTRGPKLIIFKKRRRKNSRRTRGHRQDLTEVRISAISASGEAEAAAAVEMEPSGVQADVVAPAAEHAAIGHPTAEPAILEPALEE